MSKVFKAGLPLVAFFGALGLYYVVPPFFAKHSKPTPPFGVSPDDHYITIKGLKPEDAKVKAYSTFYGGGVSNVSLFLGVPWTVKNEKGAKQYCSSTTISRKMKVTMSYAFHIPTLYLTVVI